MMPPERQQDIARMPESCAKLTKALKKSRETAKSNRLETDSQNSLAATMTGPAHQRAATQEDVANLRTEVAYLGGQVRGLQSKLHGELALLAVRIEDNEGRAMKRRKMVRRWVIAGIILAWLWQTPGAVEELLNGPFLRPGLLLVGMTVAAGITIMLLLLHNKADEQEQTDRYHNWFRLTDRSPPSAGVHRSEDR